MKVDMRFYLGIINDQGYVSKYLPQIGRNLYVLLLNNYMSHNTLQNECIAVRDFPKSCDYVYAITLQVRGLLPHTLATPL